MTEKDFERIGQLMDSKLEPINAKLNQIDARLDGMDARFQQIDARFETFKSEIISEFDHLLKIQSEEFFHEFKAATEGYAALTERVDRLEDRVEGDETIVENLDLKLLKHDRNPQAHDPSGYLVKEDATGFGPAHPLECDEAEQAELRMLMNESSRKFAAVTEEINAYCAEMGVELPKIDGEEVIRQIRLNSARRRVEQELKRRREEEQKP